MSAPDALPREADAGVAIGFCRAEVTELAALRGRVLELERIAASRGLTLPPMGRAGVTTDALVLSVRPERWLLLTSAAPAGAAAANWHALGTGAAAAVDQSSSLAALHLAGPAVREVLARGCRLDLALDSFPAGRAAATSMAQVGTILVAVTSGVLILTPASTARHLHEWLSATARPFGLVARAQVSVSTLFGHQDS